MKDEKSRYILHWISQLSKIRPELGNFSICPYASGANFSIQDQKLHQIVPNCDFDVIINVVEDDIEANFLYDAVDDYNRNYPDYKFIADHGKTKTYILAKTNYYDYWDKNYLKEVLEDDYGIINDEETR